MQGHIQIIRRIIKQQFIRKHTAPLAHSRARRRVARGVSLIEIVVAVAIIAMLSAGITVAVVKIASDSKKDLTRTNAQAIRSAVKMWWGTSGDAATCPTVGMLLADGALEKGKSTKIDAWGQPWQLKCDDSDVAVISRGPDKQAGTEDDITVPEG